jgi:hypothetical protein
MIAVIAGVLAGVHVAFSGGYGYHRDELYFVRAGRELDWGYPDQPPLTPLLARLVTELFGDSLVALRLLSTLSAGVVVVLTALLAREFGGGRGPQLLAGAAMAVSTYLTAVGHLMSTATFDLLAWTALSWLIVRALRTGGPSWLAVGVVAAIGLQNKVLVGFLLGGLLVGLLLVGPRAALRSPWPWLAGVIALLAWAPFLVWQTAHGWPQLDVATSIAAGSSGTSEPWYLFIPFQLVLISPVLVPVWVAGLVRLLRDPQLRLYRAFAVAYAALAILFLLTGGKPYYLCGLYPVLLAAGAEPALRWVGRGATRLRSALLAAALVTSAAVSAVLFLPIVPVESLAATPIVDINHDAGETVGWRPFAETIGQAVAGLPSGERATAVVLTANYGEAGAIDHYRDELGLPPAYSGHNGYGLWGPPPETAGPTIAVGYRAERLRQWFGSVEPAGRIDNGVGLDNDEQGTQLFVCRNRLRSWAEIWPQVRHLG